MTATPDTGQAPLNVKFDATATDPEGEALTYLWDFGVAGTTTDTSTQEDPTYTYTNAGTYTAKVTVTDAKGIKSSATVAVRVTGAPNQCPQNAKSDEFDGTVARPHPLDRARSADNFNVRDGELDCRSTTARSTRAARARSRTSSPSRRRAASGR